MSTDTTNSAAFPGEWQDALAAIETLRDGSVCFVMGNDSGEQASLAAQLAARVCEDGRKVAFVDANIEDSEMGYPAAISLAWVSPGIERVRDLSPIDDFFVGAFQAQHVALEFVSAAAAAIRTARLAGANFLILSLPGIRDGAGGRRLIASLSLAVAPNLILTFRQDPQIQDLLAILATLVPYAGQISIPALDASVKRSASQRQLIRGARVYAYFKEASEISVSLIASDSKFACTLNTALGTGEVLQPHLVRWVSETLHLDVVRAEITASRELLLFSRNSATLADNSDRDSGIVLQHFKIRAIRTIPMSQLLGSYLGLFNNEGKLIGVGRMAGLNPNTQDLRIITALSSNADVRVVQFGRLKITPDGRPRDEA